jgi:4'-phosphopantetheinyl transferase
MAVALNRSDAWLARPDDVLSLSSLDRQVHVWLASIERLDDVQLESFLAILSAEETARAASFRFQRDRDIYVVAHALVRTTLSHYAPLSPSAWSFRSTAHGRPEIATAWAPVGLRFNLSHTRGLVACVVHAALDVGVDVEEMRDTDLMEIAEHAFSAAEVATLRATSPDQRRTSFYRFWTLKEAYVKARGLGLSIPTTRFSLTPGARGDATVSFDPSLDDDPVEWQFVHSEPTPIHRLALAIRRGRGPDKEVVRRWVNAPALHDAARFGAAHTWSRCA